jgi:NAD+ synthase
MPIHQNPEEVDRASEHIEWLKSQYADVVSDVIDLTGVYEAHKMLTKPVDDGYRNKIADANLRSRIRKNHLYDVANRNNLLVAGTGNLVEDYGIGFFTKF